MEGNIFCMEENKSRKKRQYGTLVLPSLFSLVFLGIFLLGIQSMSTVSEEKEMENIETAIIQSAVFCYGTEGAYPESLAYLKEHYGIRYNEKKYIVDYEIIAKNIRPQVRVMRISQEEK